MGHNLFAGVSSADISEQLLKSGFLLLAEFCKGGQRS